MQNYSWAEMPTLQNSLVQKTLFRDKEFLIKRDDLLHHSFSGNKARKFHYYLVNDFPNINTVVSYGSNQSNAMYSLSVMSKLKGWKFEYFVNHIPSFLRQNPHGNYKYALENGMQIFENPDRVERLKNYTSSTIDNSTLFIKEGGAVKEAEFGIKILANEITEYAEIHNIKNLKIFLPSGTGATALFLQKNLPFEVYTCACVGGKEYLKKQFFELENEEKKHPTILSLDKKYHFGKLYREFIEIHKEIKNSTNIEFDLLYDPLGWLTLLEFYSTIKSQNSTIIYIHQGGVIGNESMIQRYNYKERKLF